MIKTNKLTELVAALTDDAEVRVKYAEHLSELLEAVDSSQIGEDYATAIKGGELERGIHILASYYRKRSGNTVLALSSSGAYNKEIADKTVDGYAREVNVSWHFEDGKMDFLFNPTKLHPPINHEWLWQFNRHYYWSEMARAYVDTRDEKYADAFEWQLLRWIAQTDIPESWNAPDSAWRTIECGLRLLGSWQVAFDGFRQSEKLRDGALLLMIASMLRQTRHLVKNPTRGNWLMMEMNGVYTFSSLFPEIKESESNRRIATEHLLREVKTQILPDGMHDELSPDYQSVVCSCSTNFILLARAFGREDEIPREFFDLLKSCLDAAIALSTPALTQPRTNDTFTISSGSFAQKGLNVFGDIPEYLFIKKNRLEGAPPADYTSIFLPYAGFAVMRSGWDADATYMCFDVGPLGMAHIHQDKLNINVYKGDEELIYDDGGGQYDLSEARKYALSAYGHNTVLVDGLGQKRKEPMALTSPIDASWITNDEFDYAMGIYDDTFGDELVKPATHKREVRFFKPDFFCVVDTLQSADGNAHKYEVLFHLDTTKVKQLGGYKNGIISDFGRKYEVAIIPLELDSTLKTVSAATEPMQGWYNGRNEAYLHEAITVSREAKGVREYKFITLIFPIAKGQTLPTVTSDGDGSCEISFNGKTYAFSINELYKS